MDGVKVVNIAIKKHTGIEEARRAIATTMDKGFSSSATLEQIYTWMHSPIRTQIFEITMEDIPTFVSVHLVRHTAQHPQPFVTSKRKDRGGDGTEDRYTPVDMTWWCNAEALIEIAGQRLCYKASKETRDVIMKLRNEMFSVDPDLAFNMVPNCVLQGGYCREPKSCGNYPGVERYNVKDIFLKISYAPKKVVSA
jgi:hypothetical protein